MTVNAGLSTLFVLFLASAAAQNINGCNFITCKSDLNCTNVPPLPTTSSCVEGVCVDTSSLQLDELGGFAGVSSDNYDRVLLMFRVRDAFGTPFSQPLSISNFSLKEDNERISVESFAGLVPQNRTFASYIHIGERTTAELLPF